jgi:hypothetical protein
MSEREPSAAAHQGAPWLAMTALPPQVPHPAALQLQNSLFRVLDDLIRRYRLGPFMFETRYGFGFDDAADAAPAVAAPNGHQPSRFLSLTAIDALYRLEQLVVPQATMDRLLDCLSFFQVSPLVFDIWNLRSIEPNPSVAVNFRGPPGTGKTMAAHAVAHHLDKKIMSCRLSDLESMYHGEGPKNLAALFAAAQDQNAILFIDEAEGLLSRRFAQPQQAAESAINSMRTELLMALDAYKGLAIFSSNLPHSYDVAIESRLFHVDFALPDLAARKDIWRSHLPKELPLAADVALDQLAEVDNVSGRDIKNAVIMAALGSARRETGEVGHQQLIAAIVQQRDLRAAQDGAGEPGTELSESDKDSVGAEIRARLADGGVTSPPEAE